MSQDLKAELDLIATHCHWAQADAAANDGATLAHYLGRLTEVVQQLLPAAEVAENDQKGGRDVEN